MKLNTAKIAIAIVVAGFAGAAFAGNPSHLLPSVTVSGQAIASCTPPNGATGHACDGFNELVRSNFTERQIGMLFGYQTSYPEYLTGGIDRLQRRYDALLQQYVAVQGEPPLVNATAIVEK